MAKVLEMHAFDLKPGTDEKAFEKFVTRNVFPIYRKVPGQAGYLEEIQAMVGNVDATWDRFFTYDETPLIPAIPHSVTNCAFLEGGKRNL